MDEDFNTITAEVEAMKDEEKPLALDRKTKAAAVRAGMREKDDVQVG